MSGYLLEILIIYASISLHELGHALAIKIFKGEVLKFNINVLGARLDANLEGIRCRTKRIIVDISRNISKFNNNYYI